MRSTKQIQGLCTGNRRANVRFCDLSTAGFPKVDCKHANALISVVAMLITKITAAQSEVTLSYHRVRGLYILAVVFVATIIGLQS